MQRPVRRAGWIAGGAAGAAAVLGVGYVASAWLRYGRPSRDAEPDELLDRFIPEYEVAERHRVRIAAPAAITYAVAKRMDLQRSPVVRAIFRGRELLMGAGGADQREGSLLEQTLRLGWRVLFEEPDREIIVGAVTQPWKATVRFRGLAPDDFAAFDEPGFAKIAWTLRVDDTGPAQSIFRTETRVATTDPRSRRLFRRYWSLMSPGILLIRRESLRLVRADAERRYAAALAAG